MSVRYSFYLLSSTTGVIEISTVLSRPNDSGRCMVTSYGSCLRGVSGSSVPRCLRQVSHRLATANCTVRNFVSHRPLRLLNCEWLSACVTIFCLFICASEWRSPSFFLSSSFLIGAHIAALVLPSVWDDHSRKGRVGERDDVVFDHWLERLGCPFSPGQFSWVTMDAVKFGRKTCKLFSECHRGGLRLKRIDESVGPWFLRFALTQAPTLGPYEPSKWLPNSQSIRNELSWSTNSPEYHSISS